jgi:hypothetical protein
MTGHRPFCSDTSVPGSRKRMGVKYPASLWTNALVFESATLGTLPSKFGEDQPQRFAGGSFVVRGVGLVTPS